MYKESEQTVLQISYANEQQTYQKLLLLPKPQWVPSNHENDYYI